MPSQRDDVAFGFDPRPFLNGLKSVEQGLGNLTKRVVGVAGQMTRKMIGVGLAIAGARAVMNHLRNAMPEVGQAFKIAGEIFWKNLAWPLRKLVVPMLQKMLDWVRDNRTRFVQWGQAVANVFKAVVFYVRTFYNMLKEVVSSLGPAFQRIFGKNMADFLNVLSLKVAFIMDFVSRIARELAIRIKELGERLVNAGILDLAKALWDIVLALVEIGKKIFVGMWDGLLLAVDALIPALTDCFKWLGDFLGLLGDFDWEGLGKEIVRTVAAAFLTIVSAIRLVVGSIQWLIETIGFLSKLDVFSKDSRQQFGKNMEGLNKRFGTMMDEIGGYFQKLYPELAAQVGGNKAPNQNGVVTPMTTVKDALITKRGEVVKLDPNDNVLATKGGLGGLMGVNVAITVTEGNARAAGEQFGLGLAERFRREVMYGAVAAGGL